MKRFMTLALIPGLFFSSPLVADSDESIFGLFFESPSHSEVYCPQPVQMYCPTPVVAVPCETRPQTVRRIVPRTTYQTVTRTVMVPQTRMETRQVQHVEYQSEPRQRHFTVYEQVPETRQVTTEYTVLVPETRARQEVFTVQVPVERQTPEAYTVNKMHTETRMGTRQICRCVPKTEMRTVITGGDVQKRSLKSDQGGVKVQTIVVGGTKTQEPVTVMRKQIVEQTYVYDVQVARPETQTRMVRSVDYRPETRTRTVNEVVQVPKTETRTHNVTEMRSVPRQKTENYTEQVPRIVMKTIEVPVTTMVAQQVSEQVPVTVYDIVEEPISDCVQCQ